MRAFTSSPRATALQPTDPSMPKDTPSTLTRTFAGIEFTVPAPYAAGYVLSADEAVWVNSQKAGAVGNAYSGDIRRAQAAGTDTSDWDHAAKFAERYANYNLGPNSRSGSGRKSGTDPVDKIAREIATKRIDAKIAAKGLTIAAFKASKEEDGRSTYVHRVDGELEKFGEEIYAQAERQHEENLAAAEAASDDDFADLPTHAAAEAAE